METNYQVTIHLGKGEALSFQSPMEFFDYVDGLRKEGHEMRDGRKVETWQQYEHLPLLQIIYDPTEEVRVVASIEALKMIDFNIMISGENDGEGEGDMLSENDIPLIVFDPTQEERWKKITV